MTGNKSLSIERLKEGDRIISVDQRSMTVEEDVVQKIDSVRHNDIVKIVFNDLTENFNTADHPYYLKGKGLCSFRPEETLVKYNIRADRLAVGDTCYKIDINKLTWVTIRSIKECPGEIMTYNITRLLKNKSYFANGILVSNEAS